MAFIQTSAFGIQGRGAAVRCSGRSHVKMSLDVDSVSQSFTHLANPVVIQKVADYVDTLGLPPFVIKWGHPAMMGFMVAGMGMPGAAFGWAGRLGKGKDSVKMKNLHEQVMIAFWLLAFAGALGGSLSLAEQGYEIWTLQDPHFVSTLAVLGLLTFNAVYAYSGFGGTTPQERLKGRTVHAYVGALTMGVFVVHGVLGFMGGMAL
ncbi:hypothetical protein NDN08_006386 [Rhodosorus marinus]|uniref:Cytochrome b561 domain-containing protein n=1 Tax=Rhodosorus marinus TaxID=101924 RepID=A0AAV8UR56_9RHOD|nr:hypothetical protein NDN08_006386 [Rhodosorus marinus]